MKKLNIRCETEYTYNASEGVYIGLLHVLLPVDPQQPSHLHPRLQSSIELIGESLLPDYGIAHTVNDTRYRLSTIQFQHHSLELLANVLRAHETLVISLLKAVENSNKIYNASLPDNTINEYTI